MLTQFFCGAVYNAVQDGYNFFNPCRAVARLFITRGERGGGGGGDYGECRRNEPHSGVWLYPPLENFQFGSFEKLFSALVMRYVDHYNQNN